MYKYSIYKFQRVNIMHDINELMCDLINVLAILYGGNLHGEYAVPY